MEAYDLNQLTMNEIHSIEDFPSFIAQKYKCEKDEDETEEEAMQLVIKDVRSILETILERVSEGKLLPILNTLIKKHSTNEDVGHVIDHLFSGIPSSLKREIYKDLNPDIISTIEKWGTDGYIEEDGLNGHLKLRFIAIDLIKDFDENDQATILKHASDRSSLGDDFIKHLNEASKIFKEKGVKGLRDFEHELGWNNL